MGPALSRWGKWSEDNELHNKDASYRLFVQCYLVFDKTLCQEVTQVEDYLKVDPISEMIEFVNELYQQGHTIYLYTGRHTMQALITKEWLAKHQVQYHHLFHLLKLDYYSEDEKN